MVSLCLLLVCLVASKPLPCPVNQQTITIWYDRDGPGGSGDWELASLQNPKPCGQGRFPVAANCRRVSDHKPSWQTGQTFSAPCSASGLVCLNSQNTKMCDDYEVSYTCCPLLPTRNPTPAPTHCPGQFDTPWVSRMQPSSFGDSEYYKKPHPCGANFYAVEAHCRRVSDHVPSALTGQTFHHPCSAPHGLVCLNHDNPGGCDDYEVKFTCCKVTPSPTALPSRAPTVPPTPSPTPCANTWNTAWLSRDTTDKSGDWELYNLFNIPPCGASGHPIEGFCRRRNTPTPSASTGQTFSHPCDENGLVCLHDQNSPDNCFDYEVRFRCCNGPAVVQRGSSQERVAGKDDLAVMDDNNDKNYSLKWNLALLLLGCLAFCTIIAFWIIRRWGGTKGKVFDDMQSYGSFATA